MNDIQQSIDELTALCRRIDQFEKDGTVSPGTARVIRAALRHVIDMLIPF